MKRWLTGWVAGWIYLACAQAGIPIEHWTLANGARVYWVHSPNLPMVDVQIDFDAGGRRDPTGRSGLASATAMMASTCAGGVSRSLASIVRNSCK